MTINSSGFTLLEFLVSTLILMVGLLGMLQGINLAIEKNLETVLRNEAVSLADNEMMRIRGLAFETIASEPKTSRPRTIRGVQKSYSSLVTVASIQNSRQINVEVTWKYKGAAKSHLVSSAVSQIK